MSLLSDSGLLTLEVTIDMDIFDGVTFCTNKMVMMTMLDVFVALNLIMEVDRRKNVSSNQDIEFSIEGRLMYSQRIFFEQGGNLICRKRLHLFREDH